MEEEKPKRGKKSNVRLVFRTNQRDGGLHDARMKKGTAIYWWKG